MENEFEIINDKLEEALNDDGTAFTPESIEALSNVQLYISECENKFDEYKKMFELLYEKALVLCFSVSRNRNDYPNNVYYNITNNALNGLNEILDFIKLKGVI